MRYEVIVTERAENHLKDAIDWYEERSKGLGKLLLVSFKDCIKLLIKNPFAFAKIYNEIRKINTKKYPYSFYYLIDENLKEVTVFAVLHSHRDPDLWKQFSDNELNKGT